MKRHSRLWFVAAVAVLALGIGAAWSLAQQPPAPPPPGPGTVVEERDVVIEPDFMADEPGGGPFGRHHGRMGFHGMGMGMDPALREELGLTEEQQAKLRSLGFDAAKTGLRAHTDLQIRRMELEELLQQDTPDKVELDKRIKALTDAQTALTRQRIEHRLAFRNVLTPEQRTKMRSLMAQRMAQRGRGMRWRERGPEGGRQQMRFRRSPEGAPRPQL